MNIMPILTANMQPAVRPFGGLVGFVEHIVTERGWGRVNWQTRGEVQVYIGWSQWRADCPHCNGSLVAEPELPFFCVDCLMQGNGGYAMQTVWPDNRDEIEGVLLRRPDPGTRNWLPHETADDLRRENAEHGIGD